MASIASGFVRRGVIQGLIKLAMSGDSTINEAAAEKDRERARKRAARKSMRDQNTSEKGR